MPIEEVLLDVALAFGIGVPHLIHGVVLAFQRAFAEVEGDELRGDVGDEGVTHGEDCIAPLVAGEEQVVAEGWLSLVGRGLHRVVGGTTFHPYEFPVEIEVIRQALPCLEGFVLGGTLSVGR